MKKTIRFNRNIIIALLYALLLIFPAQVVFASDSYEAPVITEKSNTKVTGTYYQSDSRKMLKKINKFRTGKNAWYRDEAGNKIRLKDLIPLEYDYTLEQAAMKRAAELTVSFSHTRPNGQSCFSLYDGKGYMAMGENIAYGYPDVKSVLEAWKETNEPYSGQGHRRNMLSQHFTCIGIACFEVDGIKYWVQEFGSPTIDPNKNKPVNSEKTVKVELQ